MKFRRSKFSAMARRTTGTKRVFKVWRPKDTISFSRPYNRRIARQHRHFTMEDYRKWLKKAERDDLARALGRLAQLNQAKVYLFWKKH